MVSHKSKDQLTPPTENIHRVKDDHAISKIGYSYGNIVRTGKACNKTIL